jgi:hypothetical protein
MIMSFEKEWEQEVSVQDYDFIISNNFFPFLGGVGCYIFFL